MLRRRWRHSLGAGGIKDFNPCPNGLGVRAESSGQLLRTFFDTTSIRGARRIFYSDSRFLRIFWSVFVFISLLLVFYVSLSCFQSYTNFHTVMQRRKQEIFGDDFPVITLCSDFFIGDNGDARTLVNHPTVYSRFINQIFQEALREKNYKHLAYIRYLNTTLMYNVNNVHLWNEMMKNLLETHVTMEFGEIATNHTDVLCFVGLPDKVQKCRIRPFLDLRYRNCISLEIPHALTHERVDEIHLFTMLLAETSQIVLPASRVSDGNLMQGRYFHLFLHEAGTLPSAAPNFIVSMNSNRWAIIDFDVSHVHRMNTPRSRCAVAPNAQALHTGFPVRYDVHTCRLVHRRRVVRKLCGCEAWWSPIEVWPHNVTRFCGSLHDGVDSAFRDFECVFRVDSGFKQEFYSFTSTLREDHEELLDNSVSCLEPCSERLFSPQLHGGEYESQVMHNLFADYYLSIYIGELIRKCANDRGTAAQPRSEEVDSWCNKIERVVHRLSMDPVNIDFEPLGDTIMHRRGMSQMWEKAFPYAPSPNVTNANNSGIKKTFLFLGIRPREPHVAVDQETLVWNMWTMLAQVGGASSFIAGVTFVVLGELLELVYHLVLFQCRRTPVIMKDAANQCVINADAHGDKDIVFKSPKSAQCVAQTQTTVTSTAP